MIDLPRPLAPWRASLDLFAPDVAEGLGPLLPRLALTIGPMRISQPTGDGEPDGFTGIARRGSYERLLLTEWLLADEAPLEFVRRAATGEHAFFQIARRAPARASNSVVLFDAGPDQIGAPRVAHLAALIVLAARAERAGARFAWGLLHTPDRPLLGAVTKESVQSLLTGRTAIGASAEDMDAWIDRAARSGWEDAWIVGAQTIVSGWKHSTIAVRDIDDPARRAISITARAKGSTPREVELDLPADRITARLFSNPFAAESGRHAKQTQVPAPARGGNAPMSNLVFAASGAKVFARNDAGEILAYPVGTGRPKRYGPRGGGIVAAVGWVSRGCVMLVIDEREIRIEHTNRQGPALLQRSIALPSDVSMTAPQITDPLSPLIYTNENGAEIHFTDASGALFQIGRDRLSDTMSLSDRCRDEREGSAFVHRIAEHATAIASLRERVAYVALGLPISIDEGWVRSIPRGAPSNATGYHLVLGGGLSAPILTLEGNGTFEARFGVVRRSSSLLVAVQQTGDLWTIYQDAEPIADIRTPSGTRVVGPWRAGSSRDLRPVLIAIDTDERTILQLRDDAAHPIEHAPAPITHAVLASSTSAFAYTTTEGEVVIRSLESDSQIARFEPKHVR